MNRTTFTDASPKTFDERVRMAEILAQSGVAKGGVATIFAILQSGAELGLQPMESIRAFHQMPGGKLTLSAGAISALVERSGKYSYEVVESTDTRCEIQFFKDGKPRKTTAVFTEEDARTAGRWGNDTWKKYPTDLLFARCLTRGVRQYASEVFGGAIYTAEELTEPGRDESVSSKEAPAKTKAPKQEQVQADSKANEALIARIESLAEEKVPGYGAEVVRGICEKFEVEALADLGRDKLIATGKKLKAMSLSEIAGAFNLDVTEEEAEAPEGEAAPESATEEVTPAQIKAVVETYAYDNGMLAHAIRKKLEGRDKAFLDEMVKMLDGIDNAAGDEWADVALYNVKNGLSE